ncbi:MAG: acetoin utilization protein AcuC [SAR202 cluster bacterium]|nr:acetoin utilization protein AcuC [SAR202 cluster bacterium]
MAAMNKKAAFIYDDALSQHTLSDTHPMKPVRLRYTYELLDAYGAFDAPSAALVKPRKATEEEALWYHSRAYVNALKDYNDGRIPAKAFKYNLGYGDNPAYEGVYDAALLSTGASLKAVELLLSGEADRAFSISGGLHHAMPGYAYGFCVLNDPVIAIKALLDCDMRVAYVDIDCHHGDGVQYAFYDTDQVLTISLHESGSYLFPGTGWAQEIGAGKGRGYSVNVPLYPYTTSDTYLWAFNEVVVPLLEAYKPDVLVTQLGIDTHYLDPITHIAQTVQGFTDVVREFDRLKPAKWLALGGGGYDLQAVARSWASAFAVMSGQELDDEIPDSYVKKYGIPFLSDREPLSIPDEVAKDVRAYAESSVQAVQRLIFPSHGVRG